MIALASECSLNALNVIVSYANINVTLRFISLQKLFNQPFKFSVNILNQVYSSKKKKKKKTNVSLTFNE